MPTSVRELLLVGGVFDPPHRAHIRIPAGIRDRLFGPAAWLVYVPAARSPHKPGGPVASDKDRVAMLRLALRDTPRTAIWTDELNRPPPSYWIETLRRAIGSAPSGATIRFIIGSDQAVVFHKWRDFREILGLAEPVVMLRPPHKSGAAVLREMRRAHAWTKAEMEQWGGWIDEANLMDESSTRARSSLGRGAGAAGVPPAVRAYIRRRGLYKKGA